MRVVRTSLLNHLQKRGTEMALSLFVVILAATAGLITYRLTRRRARLQIDSAGRELAEAKTALLTIKVDFDARQGELRKSIEEARERENEAKGKTKEIDQRLSDLADELKVALEEKGRLQNEATRVQETKATLLER